MPSIFGIGVTALNTAQSGLLTTGHNISNVNTPGYSRQQIVQLTNFATGTGSGFIGQGVHVETVKRIYSQFLGNQITQTQSESSRLDQYYSEIKRIDSLLADKTAGLSPALQDFFTAVQDVASNPSSTPSRQVLLSKAQTLVGRFQALNQQLVDTRRGINDQITTSVDVINSYARQIASLNQSIIVAGSVASGQPPNDLLDQRDQLITELNKEVGATVVRQSDGSYNVFIASGQSLVVGSQYTTFVVAPSPTDPTRTEVGYITAGSTVLLPESSLQGGKLGGLFAFRASNLDNAQNALGRVAIGLAGTFNDQHRLGQDLNGVLGGNFFNLPGAQINPNINNTGNLVLSAAFNSYSALTTSDYRLRYDGVNYTLTRLSDNTATVFAAFPQTIDGVTLSVAAGAANAGDEFLIQPTVNGARDISVALTDPARIAAAAPIRTSASLNNVGNATISAGSVNPPPPPNANLQQPVTITFTAPGTFNVVGVGTGNPVGVAYTSGNNITYNGWTVQITGTPAAGDVFTIGPNTSGVGDNRNALLLGQLQTQNTLVGGTTTYQGAYAQLVVDIGNRTNQISIESEAQANLLSQVQEAQQSLSGVNLDEEGANLLRYQQAYQAAGKLLGVAATLFETLLNLSSPR